MKDQTYLEQLSQSGIRGRATGKLTLTPISEEKTLQLEVVNGKAQGMDAAMRLNVLLKHTSCVFGFRLLNENLLLVQVLDVDKHDGWIKVLAKTEDGQAIRVEISQTTPFYFYPMFGK